MLLAPAERTTLPRYEVAGPVAAASIVVLGGISAHRHVCAHAADATPGWWEGIAGHGCAVDPSRHRVVSFDFLDGGRAADGRPAREVSTHDQADALAAMLDELAVERVGAIVGASYGGMVALAFAERYPDRADRLVVIGAAHRSHPMATALRVIQRRIVELGLETGRHDAALALARQLGITTYRSAREFGARFDHARTRGADGGLAFPVESYLAAHGRRFAAAWRPERFLALSLSADLHAIDASRIRTPVTLVAAADDAIVPRDEVVALSRALGGPSHIVDLEPRTGHDTFLTAPDLIGPIVARAIATIDHD